MKRIEAPKPERAQHGIRCRCNTSAANHFFAAGIKALAAIRAANAGCAAQARKEALMSADSKPQEDAR